MRQLIVIVGQLIVEYMPVVILEHWGRGAIGLVVVEPSHLDYHGHIDARIRSHAFACMHTCMQDSCDRINVDKIRPLIILIK